MLREPPAWFERAFDFSFPEELLPNICARLRGAPVRLEEVLRDRPRHVLITKAGHKWSAQEHAGHLLDLEPLWLARVEDYTAGHTQLTPTDLSNGRTEKANHNARDLDEILSGFRCERDKLLSRAGELDDGLFGKSIPHPRLKIPMRLIDHLYFVAEHDDHHLARIWGLLQAGQSG